MLTYNPRNQGCKGDENFRVVTKLGNKKRKRAEGGGLSYWKGEKGGISLENLKIAKTSPCYSPLRLCGQLDIFTKHVDSIHRKTYTGKCAVCGGSTAWKCGVCKKFLCLGHTPKKLNCQLKLLQLIVN
jgi:hypothetical protein